MVSRTGIFLTRAKCILACAVCIGSVGQNHLRGTEEGTLRHSGLQSSITFRGQCVLGRGGGELGAHSPSPR